MGRPPTRRDGALLWRVVLVLLAGAIVGVLLSQRSRARALVGREEAALAACRALLEAEIAFRERAGRYGWRDDLGALPAPGLPATPGYRIDVLLPVGRDPLGQVLLAPRGPSSYEPLLAARHLAIVARPEQPGVSGWRTFYVDETGRVLVSEGVTDTQTAVENALPRTRVEGPRTPDQPGPVWRVLGDPLEGG